MTCGRPALGFTAMGSEVAAARRFMYGSMRSGPNPQLKPIASTRSPSSSAATHSTPAPVRSLPSSPRATVASTGRVQFSLAARTAALSSYASPMVSTTTMSAPASAPMRTCSAKAS